jgi:hypothetical protein
MNDREYHALRGRPDVMRRGQVAATLSRLSASRPGLANELSRILESAPVVKPPEHRGGPETDYLRFDLSLAAIDEIVAELGFLEASLCQSHAAQAEIEAVAELLDLWNRSQRLQRERGVS